MVEFTVETNYPYIFIPCGDSLKNAKEECVKLRKQGRSVRIVCKVENGNDFILGF